MNERRRRLRREQVGLPHPEERWTSDLDRRRSQSVPKSVTEDSNQRSQSTKDEEHRPVDCVGRCDIRADRLNSSRRSNIHAPYSVIALATMVGLPGTMASPRFDGIPEHESHDFIEAIVFGTIKVSEILLSREDVSWKYIKDGVLDIIRDLNRIWPDSAQLVKARFEPWIRSQDEIWEGWNIRNLSLSSLSRAQ